MADLIATLFRWRLFVFEFGPFFLAAWFAVASATGLIAVAWGRRVNFETSKWQLLLSMLWRPAGSMPVQPFSGRIFLFSLAASVPALVVTYLIGTPVVLLRLLLAALFALFLNWVLTSALLRQQENPWEHSVEDPAFRSEALAPGGSASGTGRIPHIVKVVWRSFSGQVERAVVPLLVGLLLASALTIYVPAYAIRPWLGEDAWSGPYLAALLVTPFQLVGGAEVVLASALLTKGASLGTGMSVMLAAPVTTFPMFRHLSSTRKARTIALYLVAVWFTAGTLGVAVDGIGRLLNMWR